LTSVIFRQELISSCCSSSCSFLFVVVGRPLQKSPKLRRFKSDRDEIWNECSSRKCASIGGFGLLIYFQCGGRGVISCRKVLPLGECTHSVCLATIQQCPPVPYL